MLIHTGAYHAASMNNSTATVGIGQTIYLALALALALSLSLALALALAQPCSFIYLNGISPDQNVISKTVNVILYQ